MAGIGIGSSQGNFAAASAQSGSSATTSGPTGAPSQKDLSQAQTAPQFGDVLKKMQAQYGARPEKAREIKKTLGKDDFLKIMITQMQHQDPTNPFKAEQMASEMAQFTSVEQMQNMNQSLTKMANREHPLERLAMTNLIGKAVTVDRSRFPHVEGQPDAMTYTLPREAKEVHLALVSEQGEVVLEKDLGAQKVGENVFTWDGLKSNNLPAKGGTFMMRIEAKDDRGQSIMIDTQKKARVVGVSFEGQEPVFIVGDGKHQEKVTMRNIVRIDDSSAGSGALPSIGSAGPDGGTTAPSTNFIAFQKGVGSAPLDPGQASQEVRQALAKFQQSGSGAEPQIRQAPPEEKGFPNGLHDKM